MMKKLFLAAMMSCLFASGALADDETARPHVWDDLNDNGISDGAERAEATSGDEAQSTETDDAEQPVDTAQ